jgi:hypothetical protein
MGLLSRYVTLEEYQKADKYTVNVNDEYSFETLNSHYAIEYTQNKTKDIYYKLHNKVTKNL